MSIKKFAKQDVPILLMCKNENCEERHNCKRFMVTPHFNQEFANFRAIGGECSFFMPFEENCKKES